MSELEGSGCGGDLRQQVDRLMRGADRSDERAADALFALLYAELHRLAEHSLRRAGNSLTLSPTTVLHEAYLSMAGRGTLEFADRSRFLAYAARAMRGVVIDFVRERGARKRGRDLEVTLTGEGVVPAGSLRDAEEMTRLGDALDELAALEPSLAELVDLHFFCGFTFAEIASLRSVSERTVQRDWRKARLLLHRTFLGEG